MKIEELLLTQEYQDWLKTQPKGISAYKKEKYTREIHELVHSDISVQTSMSAKENTLFHKYHEMREWLPKQDKKTIRWVEKLIWKPTGKSDFRRIKPELILVESEYEVNSVNIWGENQVDKLPPSDALSKHWEILRVMISRARYDGFPGRQLNFLVRDKITKKYLGVISITSDMLDLSARNQSIGADIGKFYRDKHAFNITANGQTIVPTQPFGSALLGGKLLSLLCVSKEVADTWKSAYGDTLVGVTTTSLYGDTGTDGRTQYDGLTPYWKKMGSSKGSAPIKMTDKVFDKVRDWIRLCYPLHYYRYAVHSRKNSKNTLQRFAYNKLGLKHGAISNHNRNIYFSRIYLNTDEYIRRYVTNSYDKTVEIIRDQDLVPAFDNSIEALTEHWRFGHATDTTTSPKHLVKEFGKDLRRMTKGRVDNLYKERDIPTSGINVEWYEDLAEITSWEQVKKRYPI